MSEAESILLAILEADPRETQALVGLGTLASQAGDRALAIHRMGQALQVDPGCVPALCWMSYLLRENEDLSGAAEHARQAVALEPRNPATHIALARCLRRQGQFREAIAGFRAAVSLDPNNPGPMYELAELMVGPMDERDSVEILRRAVSLAPQPDGLLRLASLELELDQNAQAETDCRLALEMKPDQPAALALMAKILTEQSRLDEAEAYWLWAESLDTRPGAASLEKAMSLAAIGLFDRAQDELKRSIEANPKQGSAYQAYVFAKRIGSEDRPIVAQMERSLTSAMNGTERVALLYALGKAFDNLGEPGRAMGFFDEANSLNRQVYGIPPLDRDSFKELIDSRIRLFTDKLFGEWPHPRLESSLPLLVTGMIRSGTTLCEQMLSCHSRIWGAGEQYFWADNESAIVDYDAGSVDYERLRRGAAEYADSLSSIAPGYRYVIDKNPINFLFLGTIHLALPNARIVHTIRNACDNAISIWMTPMKTDAPFVGDRGDIVFAYRGYARLMEHWRKVLPPDRFFEIRYEDLVSEPGIYTKDLVSKLGLDWEEACLHPDSNPRRVKTPSFWQVRQPFYRSSTLRWKRYEPWLGEFRELLNQG